MRQEASFILAKNTLFDNNWTAYDFTSKVLYYIIIMVKKYGKEKN